MLTFSTCFSASVLAFPHPTSAVLGPQKGNASVGENCDQQMFFFPKPSLSK